MRKWQMMAAALSLIAGSGSAFGQTAPPSLALAGPSGFGVKSADDAYRFYLHWLMQTDYQTYVGDTPPGAGSSSTALVRFAGLQLDAVVAQRFHSLIFMDFSSSKLTLLDAWVDAEIAPQLHIKVGKFLYPISEERLTPNIWLPFVNTTFPSLLLPSRDTGIQLYGELIPRTLKYNLALTNGASAGTLGDADVDASREIVGRVFARPFSWMNGGPLAKWGLGVGAGYTHHTGTVANPELPIVRTYGGQTFFAYGNDGTAAGTTRANGTTWRVVPHTIWAWGPVAMYADWVHARDNVGPDRVPVGYDGYGAVGSVVLTGEDAEPLAFIAPRHPLDQGGAGTFLLVGGAGHIRIGSNAFRSGAASTAASMQTANVVGCGINWYPVRGIAMLGSFGHMVFEGFAGAPARPDENVLIVRGQMFL